PELPAPTSDAAAIQDLMVTALRARASGTVNADTAGALVEAIQQIAAVRAASPSVADTSWDSALSKLALLIENDQQARTIPTDVANQLATTLSYLYGSSGS
ncbi:MAG: hypothetical protein ACRDVE_00295, partial [Actinocrinis sp.]